MSLTTFQRAVLQEMGIPVWVSQASERERAREPSATDAGNNTKNTRQQDAHEVNGHGMNTASPSMPSSEEKQSRLAQLRAQVSSDNVKKSKGEASPSSAPSKKSAVTLPTTESETPATTELTQVQRLQGKAWLQDADIVFAHLNLSLSSENIKIGQALAVTKREIILPVAPHLLTASVKKRLWSMLCDMASQTTTPNTPSDL